MPNTTKSEVFCFHLNNRPANLKVESLFFGVKHKHSEKPATFRKQQHVKIARGATAQVLRTTTLSLVFRTVKNYVPVWLDTRGRCTTE